MFVVLEVQREPGLNIDVSMHVRRHWQHHRDGLDPSIQMIHEMFTCGERGLAWQWMKRTNRDESVAFVRQL